MGRFDRVLQRVDRRLEAPEPGRSRILLEMAGDLEDLYRAYRERGLDDEEARRRTEAWFDPSPDAVESLRAVHTPAIERLLQRLGGSTRGWVEAGALTLISLAAAGAGVAGVVRTEPLSASSPGVWAVAALAAAGLGAALARGYLLFVRGDRLGPDWRGGLHAVSAAAGGTAVAGLLAAALRLTTTAGPSGVLWSEVAAASAVATLGLSASLLLALLWLLLRARAGSVSRARAELDEALGDANPERAGRAGTAPEAARMGTAPEAARIEREASS